ncbi:hypothetical protein BGW38_000264, partial [Lunasporangiospora selenospora]
MCLGLSSGPSNGIPNGNHHNPLPSTPATLRGSTIHSSSSPSSSPSTNTPTHKNSNQTSSTRPAIVPETDSPPISPTAIEASFFSSSPPGSSQYTPSSPGSSLNPILHQRNESSTSNNSASSGASRSRDNSISSAKARQRRVSSVSSNHSIRQVGSYGGHGSGIMTTATMISPSRKANPYYTSVLARFSNNNNSNNHHNNGGRHSLHDKEMMNSASSSGRRRSVVVVDTKFVSTTTTDAKGLRGPGQNQSGLSVDQRNAGRYTTTAGSGSEAGPNRSVAFTTAYEEEYEVEIDDSTCESSTQGSPFGTMHGSHPSSASTPDRQRLLVTSSPATARTTNASPGTRGLNSRQETASPTSPLPGYYPQSSPASDVPSPTATWSTTAGVPTEMGSRPDTMASTTTTTTTATSSIHAGSYFRRKSMPSYDTHTTSDADMDNDATLSISTLASSSHPQVPPEFAEQGIIITDENWAEDEHEHDDDDDDDDEDMETAGEGELSSQPSRPSLSQGRPMRKVSPQPPPNIVIQRPSMEVSILSEQPPFSRTNRPLSTVSSVQTVSSQKHHSGDGMQQQQLGTTGQLSVTSPTQYKSMDQWSETSYDPCAPIRWDELFEMDPNSKGPLWLSHRGLSQIPHEFFDGLRNLRELYLDHNDIKLVPESLVKLSKLEVLDLSCNSISSFDSTAFKLKKLKSLRRLNLDHNMLTDIAPIYKLKSLRELRINHNFVPYIAIAVQNMAKLKILAVENNSLATLPETIGKLGNLCELRLSGNNLRVLPESIGSIRTLQVLALRSNLLERLPESWKDMENLTTLDLACNRLVSLPPDLVRLPRLTHLDLHDNQLETLPEKIGQLSNLVVLQLCNNHLRELPKDIGRLRDLHDLVLSFNFLQTLPDEIGKLTKLQELKFDNNPLRALPRTIQRLVNIRRVYLQGCELRELPIELGVAFRELVYLDLSGNQFEVMPALDQMVKLEELYMNNNYLREIGISSLNLQGASTMPSTLTSTTISTTATAVSASTGNNTGAGSEKSAPGAGSVSSTTVNGATAVSTASCQGNSASGGNSGPSSNILTTTTSMTTTTVATAGTGSVTGGVTASKLSELKRLRIFEAHHNQIRVLSDKIKLLTRLEVLDLGNNLLTWLPKEVGELMDLKVLILEGNPVKALPSSLARLMGTLQVFRIGEWPENGFEITRDQVQMNMKINVLQAFMPQQIERTLLWRMHDTILKRLQELDSQQYRDLHDLDMIIPGGIGPMSKALVAIPYQQQRLLTSGQDSYSPLASTAASTTPGLSIASQNMIANRNYALPPLSISTSNLFGNDSSTALSTAGVDHYPLADPTYASGSGAMMTNSEGINLNYVDFPTTTLRALPTLQLSNLRYYSNNGLTPTTAGPYSSLPLTASPQSANPLASGGGALSAFPLLNSLRPRKSQQLLSANLSGVIGAASSSIGSSSAATSGGRGRQGSASSARPKSMFVASGGSGSFVLDQDMQQQQLIQQQQLQQQQLSPTFAQQGSTLSTRQALNNRMSRVFFDNFGSKGRQESSNSGRSRSESSTLESSTLALSSDTMMALGLGGGTGYSQAASYGPPSASLTRRSGIMVAGALSAGSTGGAGAGNGLNRQYYQGGRLGDGSLLDIKSSMAIKSSPSLSSTPLPITSNASKGISGGKGIKNVTAPIIVSGLPPSLQRSASNSANPRTLTPVTPSSAGATDMNATTSAPCICTSGCGDDGDGEDTSDQQPRAPTTILKKRVSSKKGKAKRRASAATASTVRSTSTNASVSTVTTSAGQGPGTSKAKSRVASQAMEAETPRGPVDPSGTHRLPHSSPMRQPSGQGYGYPMLSTPPPSTASDPVLKIAVLKGIYDQILHNMDNMVEHNIQELPTKKNHARFRLLNSLKFLKAGSGDRGDREREREKEKERGRDRERERTATGASSHSQGRAGAEGGGGYQAYPQFYYPAPHPHQVSSVAGGGHTQYRPQQYQHQHQGSLSSSVTTTTGA